MDRSRQRACIADLDRHLLRGPVQHGLAVKTDDVDVFPGDAVLRGEGCDGFGVRDGDRALGLTQNPRAGLARRKVHRLGQRLAQQAALGFGVGPIA